MIKLKNILKSSLILMVLGLSINSYGSQVNESTTKDSICNDYHSCIPNNTVMTQTMVNYLKQADIVTDGYSVSAKTLSPFFIGTKPFCLQVHNWNTHSNGNQEEAKKDFLNILDNILDISKFTPHGITKISQTIWLFGYSYVNSPLSNLYIVLKGEYSIYHCY